MTNPLQAAMDELEAVMAKHGIACFAYVMVDLFNNRGHGWDYGSGLPQADRQNEAAFGMRLVGELELAKLDLVQDICRVAEEADPAEGGVP